MSVKDTLINLQENYTKVNECKKILKDGSYIYLLSKLKVNYNNTKKKYINVSRQLDEIKAILEKISDNINKSKKELEKNEYKLYNEAGSDIKLINSLQNRINEYKKTIKEDEDESLELLQKEEEISFNKEKIRNELVAIKKNFYEYKNDINEKLINAKKELKESKENIEVLEKEAPKKLLDEFKYLMDTKGSAVGKVQNGVCSGCKMKVSAITLDDMQKGVEIVYCDNCGRMLFYNELKDLKKTSKNKKH